MARENVLELKIVKMNDKYSVATITKQNDDVIKRGDFQFVASNGLKISAYLFPEYSNVSENMSLNIRGIDRLRDNKIIIIQNKDVPFIEKAVEELNQKYGIVKNWRASDNGVYYYFNYSFNKSKTIDVDFSDEARYVIGNYFRTEEQAQECAERIKKVIKEYHEEIGE